MQHGSSARKIGAYPVGRNLPKGHTPTGPERPLKKTVSFRVQTTLAGENKHPYSMAQ